MRRFVLNRQIDESGVSGTGIVAEGIEFENGRCVMCWMTTTSTVTFFDGSDDIMKIHGHGGKTEIVWLDDEHVIVGTVSSNDLWEPE